ncbi:hypothetical protein BBN63_17295 [Streptomyces niveus]|uniref:Uncharacterized protein n=1 Tax=Streptomyces niveus TaxID=193462 RepID=A0A1U9QU05_STRNV|nr:hypothetical protein BBN63_17295 [Streptomyces niveus]
MSEGRDPARSYRGVVDAAEERFQVFAARATATCGKRPATRPGHSLAVMYRTYAKILRGRQTHSAELIAAALRDDDS